MINTIITYFNEQLAHNEFFQGGAVLAVIGIIFSYFRGIPSRIFSWVKYHSLIEIEIPDTDPAFKLVVTWFSKQPYTNNRARDLSLSSHENDDDSIDVTLSPAPGTHYLFYRWHLMILSRSREVQSSAMGDEKFFETLTIRMMSRSRKIIYDFIDEIKVEAINDSKDEIPVYTYDHYWEESHNLPPRTPESLFLHPGQFDFLLSDMQRFLQDQDYYKNLCVPYRRGYLLHGPPGTGKTSCIHTLASILGLSIGYLDFAEISLEKISRVFRTIPMNCLIVIEDIDNIFSKKEGAGGSKFSAILNALDGFQAQEGRILIMTTNYTGELDPALLRPGRCDVQSYFGLVNQDQFEEMFKWYYGDIPKCSIDELKVTSAALQVHFLRYRNDPVGALNNLEAILED